MTTLYKYGLIAIVCITLFTAGLFWHNKQVDALVLKTQTEIAVQTNSRLIALQNSADASSLALQDKLKEIQDAKNIEIADINKRHASIVASLQNRPNRPARSVSNNPSTGTEKAPEGNTGVGLYREDSTFLAGEAARAELIKIELLSCYKTYDEVKDAIDKFKRDNPVRLDVTPVN